MFILSFTFQGITAVNKVKRSFIFAFALIQNCTTIKDIDLYLYHIYIMFNSLKLTAECFESIYTISTAIKGTNISSNKILEKSTPDERIRDKSLDRHKHTQSDRNQRPI